MPKQTFYPAPSMDLSTGLSTKPVTLVPDESSVRNRWSVTYGKYIPLSVFFSGIDVDDFDALFGYLMPSRRVKSDKLDKTDKSSKKNVVISGSTQEKIPDKSGEINQDKNVQKKESLSNILGCLVEIIKDGRRTK